MRLMYGVLGSCVSSDIFLLADLEKRFKHTVTCSRSSILSLVSRPVEYCFEGVAGWDPFNREMVIADLEKTFFNMLEKQKNDFLLVDLSHEYLPILKVDNKYITNQERYFVNGEAIVNWYKERQSACFDISSTDFYDVWEDGCDVFFWNLSQIVSLDKVIFHRVKPASVFRDMQGNLIPFDYSEVPVNIEHLQKVESIFAKHISQDRFLEVEDKYCVADIEHCWGGPWPFHYILDYYKSAYEKICAMTESM